MEISNIYVRDAQLHRVVEDIKADTVTMEVDLPVLERSLLVGTRCDCPAADREPVALSRSPRFSLHVASHNLQDWLERAALVDPSRRQ